MEPLIYYPTFEPPDTTWLKFALLYFETFRPIVPYNRRDDGYFSDDFRRVMDKTDLINLYAPDHNEGYRATLASTEEVEKFFRDPHERSLLFKQANVVRKWKNPDNWQFKICSEKFSTEWIYFCERNSIGRKVDGDIIVADDLAFLFMANLAKEIAFSETGALITDNYKFDDYTNYARGRTPIVDRKVKIAKGIISLLVPQNLKDIPIEKIIKFRNANRPKLTAFNAELDKIQTNISNGNTDQDFIDSYNNIYSDYANDVLAQGSRIASIPFAAYILLNSVSAGLPQYAKETLGAMGIILGGVYGLTKGYNSLHDKRYCKKYLTNLERLR